MFIAWSQSFQITISIHEWPAMIPNQEQATHWIIYTSLLNQKYITFITTYTMMSASVDAKVVPAIGNDLTSITFFPGLSKFPKNRLSFCLIFSHHVWDIVDQQRELKCIWMAKDCNKNDYVDLYIWCNWWKW